METTKKIGLKKSSDLESYNVQVQNDNMDMIDAYFKNYGTAEYNASTYLAKTDVLNSTAVTEGGKALDAVQANPSISGTMANKIQSINNGLGTAAGKNYATSVTSGSENLPTGGAVYSAISAAKSELNTSLIDRIYPVGSIYINASDVSPAALFGGSWEQIKDKFLLATGDSHTAGDEGGEASHTLETSEMPNHSHSIPSLSGSTTGGSHTHSYSYPTTTTNTAPGAGSPYGDVVTGSTSKTISSSGSHSHTFSTSASTTGPKGSGTAFDIMPPYLAVNVWKRTA